MFEHITNHILQNSSTLKVVRQSNFDAQSILENKPITTQLVANLNDTIYGKPCKNFTLALRSLDNKLAELDKSSKYSS